MKIENCNNFVKDNLKGKILEIGALHSPFPVNEDTHVFYQDYMTTEYLKNFYKDDKNVDIDKIVNVNFVLDAHNVNKEISYDAIISSHLFEHLCNPLMALENWIDSLTQSGYIYMLVPDKRFTFDEKRNVTPLKHFIMDYENKTKQIYYDHYLDFCKNVEGKEEEAILSCQSQKNIHVHTFTEQSLLKLLQEARKIIPFNILDYKREGINLCVLLQKETRCTTLYNCYGFHHHMGMPNITKEIV